MDETKMEPIVIFNGRRNFEATRATAQVMIVDHVGSTCVEVVAFDKSEAPRLYLSSEVLYSQIDRAEVAKLVEARRHTQNERRKSRDGQQEEMHCLHDLAVQYILERLSFRLIGGKPTITMNALPENPLAAGLLCQKPADLHPMLFAPRKQSES
jgi:hypothetical protein